MGTVVEVTLHDLDSSKGQDGLAGEVFDELAAHAASLGFEGAPAGPSIDGDTFIFKLKFATPDQESAKKLAWRALGTAVFAVHARHWIGQPGGTDPLEMTKGLAGKQVAMTSEVVNP